MIDPQAFGDLAAALQQHVHGGAGGALPGHSIIGAIFLFVGSLLVAELLAGPVWRSHRVLTLSWPAALVMAGIGMLLVTAMQSTEKSLHLTLAVLLLIGAYVEVQYRQGYITRQAADSFGIPALIVGGFVIGPMHSNGPLLASTMAQAHLLVGIVCWALAGLKLAQVLLVNRPIPSSVLGTGPSAALKTGIEYSFGFGVMALGVSLLLVQQLHGAQ